MKTWLYADWVAFHDMTTCHCGSHARMVEVLDGGTKLKITCDGEGHVSYLSAPEVCNAYWGSSSCRLPHGHKGMHVATSMRWDDSHWETKSNA